MAFDNRPAMAPLRYCYLPLPTPTSVRILTILPSFEGWIECKLEIADLDSVKYNALSYTWSNPVTLWEESLGKTTKEVEEGVFHNKTSIFSSSLYDMEHGETPKFLVMDGERAKYFNQNPWIPRQKVHPLTEQKHEIIVDGKFLDVTENLYLILDYLRCTALNAQDSTRPASYRKYELFFCTPLWIDAICINQNDLVERSQQVLLMGRIFKSASTTIAWLGPKDRLAKLASEALETVYNFQEQADKPIVSTIYHFPGMTPELWFSIFAILQSLWFRRAWIVQEAVFARTMILQFGSKEEGSVSIEWQSLISVAAFLSKVGLMAELNQLGQNLISGQPLHSDLRRLFQDKIAIDILESSKSPWVTPQSVPLDLKDSISVILGIQETRERLGLVQSRCQDGFTINYMTDGEIDISPTKLQSGTVTFEIIHGFGSNDSDGRKNLCTESKLLELVRSAGVTRKNRVVCATSNGEGTGGIMTIDRPLSLIEALSAFRNCGSTDPRDKVFAYLGICTGDHEIIPDYSMSAQEVFLETTKSILASTESLAILSQVQDSSQTSTQKLPSWVPDFAAPLGKVALTAGMSTSFNASGQKREAQVKFERGCSLSVEGFKINRINQVAEWQGDKLLNILQIALMMAPDYASIDGKPITRTTIRDEIQMPSLAGILSDFRLSMPESTFYIASGSSTIRIPPLSRGKANEDRIEEPSNKFLSRFDAVWHCLIAFGYRNEESLSRLVWEEAFSDWLCCKIIEACKDVIILGKLIAKPSLPLLFIKAAKERLFKERVLPKLVAWLSIVLGTQATYSATQKIIEESIMKADGHWESVVELFQKYLLASFSIICSLPAGLGLRLDELYGKPSVDLSDITKITILLSRLETAISENVPKSDTKEGEAYNIDTFREIKNICDRSTQQRIIDFEARMEEVTAGRRLFITQNGLLGIGPKSIDVKDKDEVWILRGASVPFILRPIGNGKFRVIGEAYVHGIMRGELVSGGFAKFVQISLI